MMMPPPMVRTGVRERTMNRSPGPATKGFDARTCSRPDSPARMTPPSIR